MTASPKREEPHALRQEPEIDLLELYDVLREGWKLIALVTVVCFLFSIFYALTQIEIYRAEALLASAESRESNSPLSAQLPGAAALIGINIGESAGSRMQSVLATLNSREFLLSFINKNGLREFLTDATGDAVESKTDWAAYRAMRRILQVAREGETGLVRVAIEWPDPQQAAEWVNGLVVSINEHEKNLDVEEAKSAIEYLETQLSNTQLVEMQRVFYQLIESQTRVIMLADSREEYVFRVIDPAVIPDERIAPNRRAIVLVWTVAGLALSMLFVVFKYFVTELKIFTRNPNRETSSES